MNVAERYLPSPSRGSSPSWRAARTAKAFPELAAAGGGVEGLSRPGSARQLLAGMGEAV